jgi:E3 UFM1-protein ligase 1
LTSRSIGAQYIPHIYTKTQTDWVQNFFKQNGYVEYDAVAKLGVSDPKSFIQKQLVGEKLQALQKCTIGQRLIDQVESALEECLCTNSYLDISTQLPSAMSEDDVDQLMSIIITPAKQKSILLLGTVLLTNKYMDELVAPCHDIVKANATKSVESGAYQQYFAEKQLSSKNHDDGDDDKRGDKRDERRRKAAGGKTGGGTQGRETKTKSTKKHYRGGGGNKNQNFDSDSDDQDGGGKQVNTSSNKSKPSKESTLQLVNEKEIVKVLNKTLADEGLEDLAGLIAKHYYL